MLINPISVRKLRLKWRFIAGFDISATPAVANGVVYFPSWNGFLYAVRADNGALIWKQNLGTLTGLPPVGAIVNVTVSRSTPTVAGDLLICGVYGPAVVVAVRRLTGELVWLTRLDPRPLAQITASGTFYSGLVDLLHGINSTKAVDLLHGCNNFLSFKIVVVFLLFQGILRGSILTRRASTSPTMLHIPRKHG